TVVGIISERRVEMTAKPQMVAVFNGLGGLVSVFMALHEVYRFFHVRPFQGGALFSFTSWFSIVVGAVTFSGSIVAYLKLQELMPTRAIILKGQRLFTIALFMVTVLSLGLLIKNPTDRMIFSVLSVIAAVLGILLVIPI